MTAPSRFFACWILGAFAISAATAAICAAASPRSMRSEGLAQWHTMETVLASPRCINCHTDTNFPRQGDDRHRHNFLVERGPDGHGAPGLHCATCHHDSNSVAGVPGAPGWHMAPLSMQWERAPGVRMTSRELCEVLTDPSRNGHRDAAKLIEHHATEPLVLWAFSPGRRADGTERELPPVSHDGFVAATRAWAAAGHPCP
jgi:hypothetical protein